MRIEGFRGALRAVELDFGNACKSLVIYGDNGTGKSTFADAVEWFFTERIGHLTREGCQDQAYRNRRLPVSTSATVEIVFDDGAQRACRSLDGLRQPSFQCPDDLRDFIAAAGRDTFILRHAQMRDFVDKTKTDKLKYIAEILGLGELAAQRDQLASAARQLRSDSQYKSAQENIKDCQKRLATLTGVKKAEVVQAIQYGEQLRVQLGGEIPIVDVVSLRRSTEALLARRGTDDRAQRIAAIDVQRKELQAGGQYAAICDEVERVAGAMAALRADKRAIDERALAALYQAGQDVLQRDFVAVDTCPLCGQPADHDALQRRLAAELAAFGAIQARIDEIGTNVATLRTRVNGWQVWATRIAATSWISEANATAALTSQAAAVALLATGWTRALQVEDIINLAITVAPEQRAAADTLAEQCRLVDAALASQVARMEAGSEEAERNLQLDQLDSLNEAVQSLERARRQTAAFERQIETMDAINKRFETLEKETLEHVLSAISDDVNRFYLLLHPNEGFDHVRLTPTTSRGIEFAFEYHGELISPPGQLLSESHLNTLGICLFLAAARHFNRRARFLILDDIVNSVDAGHRQMMARLLRNEFEDTQIMLFTHDDVWFDMVKKLTNGVWQSKRISGWQYDVGFWLDNASPDLDAEIRHLLDVGDVDAAGNKARRWFEYRLKRLCHHWNLELAFQFNDKNEHREIRELLPKVKTFLTGSRALAHDPYLFNDLETNQFVGNQLSHDGSSESIPPKAADVRLMLDDLCRLDRLVTCPDCGKIPKRSKPCGCSRQFSLT